jgi:hypothetical protein
LSRLQLEDLQLVDGVGHGALAHYGTAPSRIGRLTKRVRGFAQVTQAGLLEAGREDVAAFAASRAARLPVGHVDPLKVCYAGGRSGRLWRRCGRSMAAAQTVASSISTGPR